MRVTINKAALLDRVDPDGTIVTRIPKTNDYLYLDAEDVVDQDDKTIVAELKENESYYVNNKANTGNVRLIKGSELYGEHYEYVSRVDPTQRQEIENQKEGSKAHTQKSDSQTAQAVMQGQQAEPASTVAAQGQNVYMDQIPGRTPSPTQNTHYSKEQFRQIQLGRKHHLDVSHYWDIKLSSEQMKQLRLMLEQGININQYGYNHPSVPADVLQEMRLGHLAGTNMSQFRWQFMSCDQLRQIRIGAEKGLDVSQYAFSAYDPDQMREMRLALQSRLNVAKLRNPHFTAAQMRAERHRMVWARIRESLRSIWEEFKSMLQESSLGKLKDHILDRINQGLDRTTEALTGENSVNPFKQQVSAETMQDRIQETVQDIKELLVAQELVPEKILYDKALSAAMSQRIQNALDQLMQPDSIQNVENQETIMNQTTEQILQDSGVKLELKEESAELNLSQQQEPRENIAVQNSEKGLLGFDTGEVMEDIRNGEFETTSSMYENHVEQTVLSDQSMRGDVPDNFMSAEEEAALLMEYDMQRAGFDMSDMCMEG